MHIKKSSLAVLTLIIMAVIALGVATYFVFHKIIPNTNQIMKTNLNKNISTNNENLNTNTVSPHTHAALSSNVNQNENANMNTNSATGVNTNTALYRPNGSGSDSDGDKLSDSDEVNYYKTNPNSKDTDGDGNDDLREVQYRYNPLGPGRATPEQRGLWAMTPSQEMPLIISNPTFEQSAGVVKVSWTTNIPASSSLYYGLTDAYGQAVRNLTYVASHSLTFPITSGKAYHIKLSGCALVPEAYCRDDIDQTFTSD